MRCTSRRQMESPRPVPSPTFLVVKNGSKTRSRLRVGMPRPLSETLMTMSAPWVRASISTQPSVRSGSSPWRALSVRLNSTCWSWSALPRTASASPTCVLRRARIRCVSLSSMRNTVPTTGASSTLREIVRALVGEDADLLDDAADALQAVAAVLEQLLEVVGGHHLLGVAGRSR